MANIKGSLFIRRYGIFYKVITIRRTEDCYWILNCLTLETKQKKVLKYKLSGMLEALELASKKMKYPQDIINNIPNIKVAVDAAAPIFWASNAR